MAYYLTNLLQDAYRSLGQTDTFKATGGSTTTIISTILAEKYQADDLKNYTAFVSYDAGGAGAAPEGEFQRVSGYVESTNTLTVDTAFTVAPASGDIITIASPMFGVHEMVRLARIALEYLGDIVLIDTTTTIAAEQTEYSSAVALKREKFTRVQIQGETDDTDDNRWVDVNPSEYYQVPAAPGSTGLLVFRRQLDDGHNVKIWYEGVHPALTVYNSVISETIHPNVASSSLVAHACQWYNSMIAGQDDFWLQRENKAWKDLEIALQKHPLFKHRRKNPVMTLYDEG